MQSLLGLAQQNFQSAPRPFPKSEQKILRNAPSWIKTDELGGVIKDFPTLWNEGRVVLAARVMANVALYAPGEGDSAMLAIWSEDTEMVADETRLPRLAGELFALKNKTFEGPRGEIAKILTDEMSRPCSVPIPGELAGEAKVFLSALLVFRAHLPSGFLSGTFLPLLVCPEKTKHAAILPGSFWPDAWKDR